MSTGSEHDPLLGAIHRWSRTTPTAPALSDGAGTTIQYAELPGLIDALAGQLRALNALVILLDADNGPLWALVDLAARAADLTLVPVPAFFSDEQRRALLQDCGASALLVDSGARKRWSGMLTARQGWRPLTLPLGEGPTDGSWQVVSLTPARVSLPFGTRRITYTSGSTGSPKGVCLGTAAMDRVARSLVTRAGATPQWRHLGVLPLAVLLEHVAGLCAALLAGACCLLPPLPRVGWRQQGFDGNSLLAALDQQGATSAVLVPELLRCLTETLQQNDDPIAPETLRYLAVGGAPVPIELLRQARHLGLPVRQGYGLSECASVVSVNGPDDDLPGSVGKPLEHVTLRIADDGEIQIRDPGFLGYLGEPAPAGPWWSTGDIGRLDEAGRLHILGRRKEMFITSYGRNVSPAWVEATLLRGPIRQAAVFGEGQPVNGAVLFAIGDDATIEAALAAANAELPDYARIGYWLRAETPFTPGNGLLNAAGLPNRPAIAARYGEALRARRATASHPVSAEYST